MIPKLIFSDFDGTLTDGERLSSVFFDILDWSHNRHIPFIVISGRPLSWAHFLLTHLDLPYAIMEGGGVIAIREERDIRSQELASAAELSLLQYTTEKLLNMFKIPLTGDSLGRRCDRAIERGILDADHKLKANVENFLTHAGANWSYSSVHLNYWFGDLSKASAAKELLKLFYPQYLPQDCLFFGDAPNDQSMFAWAGQSVGVSNISPFLPQLINRPKIVLSGHENRGPFGVLNYLRSLSP